MAEDWDDEIANGCGEVVTLNLSSTLQNTQDVARSGLEGSRKHREFGRGRGNIRKDYYSANSDR